MISGIVGLDLSITGSGVVRYSTYSKKYELVCTIGTSSSFGNILERLEFSATKINSVISQDDVVFIEDYAYNVKQKASRLVTLAELNGLIKFLIYRKTGNSVVTVASGSIKKWFSRKGNLPKDDFKIEAYKKYNREFKTKDEVIAYSLTDFGIHLLLPPQRKLLKYEEKVLKDFKKKHSEILQMFAEAKG